MKLLPFFVIAMFFTSVQSNAQAYLDYLPLEKGTTTEYSLAIGSDLSSADDSIMIKLAFLEETEDINGKTYYQTQLHYGVVGKTQPVDGITYIRKDEKGNFMGLLKKGSKEHLVLPADLKVGKTWDILNRNGEEGHSKIISMDSPLRTPAGQYLNCMVVETVIKNETQREYYKNSLGRVAVVKVMNEKEYLVYYKTNLF